MRNQKLIELIKSNPKTNLLPTDNYKRLISNVVGCLWAAQTDEEIQILLFCIKEIEDWRLEDRIKYFSATPITDVVIKQQNLI